MRYTSRFATTTLAVLALASAASAAGLAPKGQKAVLEYTIEVEGKANSANNSGEYQNRSTRRSLAVKATLVAMQPSVEDPGEPGGPHVASKRPNQPFQLSPASAALFAEMEKCGEDMSCRMRVTQKMMQNPQIQADMQKAGKAAEKLRQGSPRYQMWFADPKSPSTGTVKMERQTDQLFKTSVKEYKTCREYAEFPFEQLLHGGTWPATFRFDAQTGTYAANVGGLSLNFIAKTDCVSKDERGRTEQHTQTGVNFLPEKYQQGKLEDTEVFRGGADAAAGGRRLAHGERVLTGFYGSVMGGVPETAKITVRWTLTLKD